MTPEEQLRAALGRTKVVFVTGTGVSIAASGNHPQASWAGLLKHGVEKLNRHKWIEEATADAYLTLLSKAPKSNNLISIAEAVQDNMSGSQFADWLKETIGTITAKHREVLDALEELRKNGHFLATTNYDSLLLHAGVSAVTWKTPAEMLIALQQNDTSKILYLHGHWQRPDSVILDWNSYKQIARDELYRGDLEAIWKTKVWVYVGCGTSGLADPDLGLLLDTHAARARAGGQWDFCLVRESQRAEFQAEFDKRNLNIHAVPVGAQHEDLPVFLKSLVRMDAPAVVPPAPARRELKAVPDYLGSHQFVGRKAQLDDLNDWAKPADQSNLLIFDAIGGTGKSMLTWEWTTKHAPAARTDWAGRFWYSFYERGAYMEEFCRHALAYMTCTDEKAWEGNSPQELEDALLAQLHDKPYLLVLDGLERVLVAYDRFDAAEVPDEEANAPTDKVLTRDPCHTIRDADGDLLRRLAGARPSKILVSSRLLPRVLLNPAGQPIPGARRISLTGLRPAEAEELLRSCGISGDSARMQSFLTENCDNHPLTTGILGGLIAQPGPHPNDFDAWERTVGAKLDLASLNLIQRRNHVLWASIDALSGQSRALLSLLALVPASLGYAEVATLAERDVAESLKDLERRGLVQFDGQANRYDLHPVVRGVAAGRLDGESKGQFGQRVVDHFNAQPHPPFDEAKTMEDVAPGLHVVRTLLRLGRFQEAADAYSGSLGNALRFNLEANGEVLALLRPFFPDGWGKLPDSVSEASASYLANSAAVALSSLGEDDRAIEGYSAAVRSEIKRSNWKEAATTIRNVALSVKRGGASRLYEMALALCEASGDDIGAFVARMHVFLSSTRRGDWEAADPLRAILLAARPPSNRAIYRPGTREYYFAWADFWRGTLTEETLVAAESALGQGGDRLVVRDLLSLRGHWQSARGEWAEAGQSYSRAIEMARERKLLDEESEARLALAHFHLGKFPTVEAAREEAERLCAQRHHRLGVARLWMAIGDREQATKYALKAYEWAWGDGEPRVHRYYLTEATKLLDTLDVRIPVLPPYDPSKDTPFEWEAELWAAIEKMKKEKA